MPDIYQYAGGGEQIVKNEVSEIWKVDRVEYSQGIRVYLEGCSFPQKGLPTKEALFAINQVKKILKMFHIFIWSRKRFEELCWPVISPYILKEEYQQVFTKEFAKFFTGKTAEIISHIFEYDWAYRLRLQDMLGETTKDELLKQPYREVTRIVEINKQRDYKEVSDKFRFLPYIFLIPSVRRRFRHALKEIDFAKLQFDEGDMYWANQRLEYNTFGKTFEERTELLKGYQVVQSTHINREMGKN